jgi:long-chain acyl-CoA synthetase
VAVLSYTSGTTGRPKGVVLTHRYLVDNAHRVIAATGIKPGMEYLTYIAPAWATEQFFGVTIGLLLPLVVNFPESPEEVLNNIRELAVEVMVFAPRQWESLAATIQGRMLDAGRMRRAIYAWGVDIGHKVHVARLEGKPIPFGARLGLPFAEMLVLKPLRDKLGLTRISSRCAAGPRCAGCVPPVPCHRRAVAQHLWHHRDRSSDPAPGRSVHPRRWGTNERAP